MVFQKRNAKIFNNTTTIIPTKYGRQNSDFQRFFSKTFRQQPAHSDLLPPICQHVTNNIVWYETGHVGFVIRMNGLPFDGVEDNYLYTQFVGLKNMLAGMGKTLGNRLAVWTTLQRKN